MSPAVTVDGIRCFRDRLSGLELFLDVWLSGTTEGENEFRAPIIAVKTVR